LNKNLKQKVLK